MRDRNLLRAAAVWTVFVWATFVRNIASGDRSTGFKVVHIALAVVSIAFAVVIWRVADRIARADRADRA